MQQVADGLIPEVLVGLDRFEARERVVEMLAAQGLLAEVEDRTIQTPYGDRGGVVIEPWLTDQWYVDAEKLAKAPIEAVRDGRIEIVPGNIAPAPWYYTAAVADHPSACRLLMAADAFIAAFTGTPERAAIERQWQGGAIAGTGGYRDEPGGLRGAAELAADYAEAMGRMPNLAPPRGGVALRNVA